MSINTTLDIIAGIMEKRRSRENGKRTKRVGHEQ